MYARYTNYEDQELARVDMDRSRWNEIVMQARTRPLLWSSGQSSWLQILRPGFDSRHYQKKK
jgi:hypothetical protein